MSVLLVIAGAWIGLSLLFGLIFAFGASAGRRDAFMRGRHAGYQAGYREGAEDVGATGLSITRKTVV